MDEDESHRAPTPNFDKHVCKMATELEDTKLLAKMLVGDMMALDAVYHRSTLLTMYT